MQVKISAIEESRIDRAIQAAVSGSWEEFSSLTDTPFPNDESMREQFDDSSPQTSASGRKLETRNGR